MIHNMKTIAVTMDENLIQRMDRLFSSRGDEKANRSRIVREAVSEYLSRLERVAEEEKERGVFRQHRRKLARQTAALVKEQARR
jgi:metal-responsive CopG/Arc/MetJ family transcriptional regulator